MPYIEVRTTLPDHRKAKAVARQLVLRRAWVVGHLVCLWAWALENVPSNGSLAGIDDADLEDAAQWPEERAGQLVPALVDAGFIDDLDGVRYLHDWDDYAGRLLRRREEDRARKAAERATHRPPVETVDKSRPHAKRSSPTDKVPVSAGQVPKSATPPRADARPPARRQAPARAVRTAPHPTVPNQTERREAPPARPRARAAGPASTPFLDIQSNDPRYLVAKVLARRFKWTSCSDVEWDAWWEEVDNEFPAETAKGQDPKIGWRWLATQLEAAPRDAPDVKRWFFEQRQSVKAERLAQADADEAAWQATKQEYAEDAGPLAAELAANLGPPPKRNGHAVNHDKAIALLRQVRGQVTAEAWAAMLERHGVSEGELDAQP